MMLWEIGAQIMWHIKSLFIFVLSATLVFIVGYFGTLLASQNANISDAILGAVIASTISILTLLISNAHNTKQLALQLTRTEKENERQRQHSLRQSVYLDAVMGFEKAKFDFAKCLLSERKNEALGNVVSAFSEHVGKLELVASSGALLSVISLDSIVGEMSGKLTTPLQSASDSENEIRISRDYDGSLEAQLNSLYEEMLSGLRANLMGKAEADIIQKRVDELRILRLEEQFKIEKEEEVLKGALDDFVGEYMKYLPELQNCINQVRSALRKDMGFETETNEATLLRQRAFDEQMKESIDLFKRAKAKYEQA